MDIDDWLKLVFICLLGASSPGPSLALVANNAIVKGRFYGIVTSLGHGFGIGLWALVTAVGISEVVVDGSVIKSTLQVLGACLIGYLGFRTFGNGDWSLGGAEKLPPVNSKTLVQGMGEGFLISIFNPKIALFFLAIFSHLVSSGADKIEILLVCSTAAFIDAFWYIAVSLMLTESPLRTILLRRGRIVSQISGVFLFAIAAYLIADTFSELL